MIFIFGGIFINQLKLFQVMSGDSNDYNKKSDEDRSENSNSNHNKVFGPILDQNQRNILG